MKLRHLELWSGVLAVLAAMGAPWMTYLSSSDFSWQATLGAVIGSLVAGAAAGKLWADDKLTTMRENRRLRRETAEAARLQTEANLAPGDLEHSDTKPDL